MSEARKSRIGFIGAGGFATNKMYPNLHKCPQIDLVAICDINREAAERNARNFGAKSVYTDIDEMLDKEELDGVFCIGSGPQQYELSPKVLTRGIPVYVEKPSANKSSEAKELAELAEANNTWGQVGFMKRFAHVYKMAKEVMARPEFGEVSVVKTQFTQGPYPKIWGIDSAKRAFLIGQIVHICDLSRYFGGDVESISALYHEVTDVNFAYMATVKYKSGAIGTFDWNAVSSKNFRDIVETLEVSGFETSLTCRDMLNFEWMPREDWSDVNPAYGRYLKTFQPAWAGMASDGMFGYTEEVAHFALKCIGLAEGGPDLWDCYHALKIGEAVYDSAHSGETVKITDL
jgi:myo-inositol 2-dehydrogenase/D-chiro-inositol 1-dehydrogenase